MATFSKKLFELLNNKKPITIQEVIDRFAEKSFAVLLLLLLALPALPLPTGGLTHILEIIAMLVALELIIGRKTVWLPKRWSLKPLPKSLVTNGLPKFIKIIQYLEKYSKPRFRKLQINKITVRLIGLIILIFIIFSFLAPPFSGLDTLPALGVLMLALAIILEDFLLTIVGIIVGNIGILMVVILGKIVFHIL